MAVGTHHADRARHDEIPAKEAEERGRDRATADDRRNDDRKPYNELHVGPRQGGNVLLLLHADLVHVEHPKAAANAEAPRCLDNRRESTGHGTPRPPRRLVRSNGHRRHKGHQGDEEEKAEGNQVVERPSLTVAPGSETDALAERERNGGAARRTHI